jgi:5-methylcytosine-specific restriction endonuclease McrA
MSQHSHLYNCSRWRKLRRQYLARNPLCVTCRRQGRTHVATHLDHVEPHDGDPVKFWAGPFQSLCSTYHSAGKQSEERTGRKRGCDVDGKPFDQSHPVDAKMMR